MTGVFALADDLSGAAEVAAVLMSAARPARIALSGPPYAAGPVVVADLDGRHRTEEQAGDAVRAALRHAGDRHVFLKIDSLLRGHIAVSAAATLRPPCDTASPGAAVAVQRPSAAGSPGTAVERPSAARSSGAAAVVAVLAPALPSAGRTVVGGVPLIHGVPLRETRAWQAESRPAPASVLEALGGLPSVLVPLATVRAGHADLAAALSAAAGRVAVCDAETDADLDAVVAAALSGAGTARPRLIGAGGLAAALGRALNGPAPTPAPDAAGPAPGIPLLVVVGTAEPDAADQAKLLIDHGAAAITLTPPDFTAPAGRQRAARRVRDALRAAPPAATVLTIQRRGPAPPTLTRTLAGIVRQALEGTPADLVLTGGETARRVLDALGVRELIPVAQIHHGAVHSRTPEGRSVVTRPGSFGGRDSLLRIAAHLRPHVHPTSDTSAKG
jgi:4-hydroxythreonine-4-phosphate dehydrogenase